MSFQAREMPFWTREMPFQVRELPFWIREMPSQTREMPLALIALAAARGTSAPLQAPAIVSLGRSSR
ncbi:hypothetical protein [Amycolatopsis sp. NPDC004625]|uniref:hypothetical protein n=1 Tax=Amycolatopsis sp. NPDC004625 TaxID=3154670 RepID=UPI0033B36716